MRSRSNAASGGSQLANSLNGKTVGFNRFSMAGHVGQMVGKATLSNRGAHLPLDLC